MQIDEIVPFRFTLVPAFTPEYLHENMRSSIARDLPSVRLCSANGEELSIAGGGPSLADTYCDLTGYVGAVNGSLAYLLDKGIVPHMCGVCDPSPHMCDIIEADPRVAYFLASSVHPSVFDKIINAGCRVFRWNVSSIPGGERLLAEIEPDNLIVGGGSTMGLRWLTLGYTMGFRTFNIHGLDSSFRVGPEGNRASHAYADHQDEKDWISFEGRKTRVNFIGQVIDFIGAMERLNAPDVDPVTIRVFGDGLLQDKWRMWKAAKPGAHEGLAKQPLITDNFVWPEGSERAKPAIVADAEAAIPEFMKHVHNRRVAVQAGGNVGVYPAHLAMYFGAVHTFEPDASNYSCLARNIAENGGRIAAHFAAVGESSGTASTESIEAHNSGAIRVKPGDAVQMRPIDDLGLSICDLIWLDIEGYEEPALRGAAATIAASRPAIIIEEKNGMAEMHGLAPQGARAWLAGIGYKQAAKVGNDVLFLPC